MAQPTWSPLQRAFLTAGAMVLVGAGIRETAPLVNLLLLARPVTSPPSSGDLDGTRLVAHHGGERQRRDHGAEA
jgi:hypothetical protein